jgi:hypothetical protein
MPLLIIIICKVISCECEFFFIVSFIWDQREL